MICEQTIDNGEGNWPEADREMVIPFNGESTDIGIIA